MKFLRSLPMGRCIGISHGAHWQSLRELPWEDLVTAGNIIHPTLQRHHRQAGETPCLTGALVLAVKGARVGL